MKLFGMEYPIKKFSIKILWAFLLLAFSQGRMLAQDSSTVLSLEMAISKAQMANQLIQQSTTSEAIARAAYKETNAIYLPQISIGTMAMATNNPLNAFGFKLQQQSVKAVDFNPDFLNSPGSRTDFNSRIQLNMPVYNPALLYLRKAAATNIQIQSLKTTRTRQHIRWETEKLYLQLQMAYDAKKVLTVSLQAASALYTFTNNRVEEGLLQKSDALNVKVWISTIETHLTETNNNIKLISDYLSWMMGENPGMVYKPIDANGPVLPDSMLATIPANRPELAAYQKALEAHSLMMKSTRMKRMPAINGFASYQVNDKTATGFGAGSYLAGIQLNWNIFNGNAYKNKLQTQLLEKKKMEQELAYTVSKDQVALNKANYQLQTTRQQMLQIETAIENAAEALRILTNRYEQGLVNNTDVLMAQTQLSNQQLALARATHEYRSTQAEITFLTANEK